jgi:hypothetical protein
MMPLLLLFFDFHTRIFRSHATHYKGMRRREVAVDVVTHGTLLGKYLQFNDTEKAREALDAMLSAAPPAIPVKSASLWLRYVCVF